MPTPSARDVETMLTARLPTQPAGQAGYGGPYDMDTNVDKPLSNEFGFGYPTDLTSADNTTHDSQTHDTHSESAEANSLNNGGNVSPNRSEGDDSTPTNGPRDRDSRSLSPQTHPGLSRAFSMPLPSQLTHLKNPRRLLADSKLPSSPIITTLSPGSTHFHELSLELADSVQMVIQTLLRISPPQLLDPAKEQFSACSLSIPSPSVTAMLTAMKNLNYMSANMPTFSSLYREREDGSGPFSPSPTQIQDDFDIGETLQSVGDALSGLAAQAGVDLVLFHADVGMKHVSVRADECGISYALSHIVRQILDTAQPGDTIEIGLFIAAEKRKALTSSDDSDGNTSSTESNTSLSSSLPLDGQGTSLRVTFDIAHKFGGNVSTDEKRIESYFEQRPKPHLDSQILHRLLFHLRANLQVDQRPRFFPHGRACELSLIVDAGSPEVMSQHPQHLPDEEIRQPYANANIQLATEPSLEELMTFAETLKGKKVALHASEKGSFAHHLTSYLTAWGLDVSHMSTVPPVDSETASTVGDESVSSSVTSLDGPQASPSTSTLVASPAPMDPSLNPLDTAKPGGSPAFVIIDDDVEALRRRLLQLRTEAPYTLSLHPKRPNLSTLHRPRSTPQVMRAKGVQPPQAQMPVPLLPPVIVHFTSLANYKLVKDVLQSVLSMTSPSCIIPEVIVLPKPAGPRRLLTALRTAVVKPVVDPFFAPIATSPMSPSVHGLGANYFSQQSPSSRTRPTISPRTNSDGSTRSDSRKDHSGHPYALPPPSPLREADTVDYFPEAAVQLGSSPSSGLVIQSPDGQPAGIFFHPRGTQKGAKGTEVNNNGSSVASPPHMVRDNGSLRLPDWRKLNQRRVPSDGETYSPGMMPGSSTPTRPAAVSRNRSTLSFAAAASAEALAAVSVDSITSSTPMVSARSKGRRSESVMSPSPSTSSGIRQTGSSPHVSPQSPYNPSAMPGPVDSLLRVSTTPPASPRSPSGQQKRMGSRRTSETAENSASRKSRAAAESNIVPPINVLIVEDNPINQTILSTFMKKKKIKYDVAKNGEEAVAKWKSGTFHLILMDIQMPVMDGIEATKAIRREEKLNSMSGYTSTTPTEGARTPSEGESRASSVVTVATPFRSSVIIVALTASSLQSDRVAALAAGCNDFLTKPVSLQWLNNKIIEWGSIKALQMWADLRPEVVQSMSRGQVAQAKNIASKLYVPPGRHRSATTSPSAGDPNWVESPKPFTPGHGRPPSLSMSASHTPLATTPAAETPRQFLTSPIDSFDADQLFFPPGQEPGRSKSSRRRAHETIRDTSMEKDTDGTPDNLLDAENESVAISDTLYLTDSSQDQISPRINRPSSPRVISGERALRSHLKDSEQDASVKAELDALGRPLLLGERALSTGNVAIAELLHPGYDSDGFQPSKSAEPEKPSQAAQPMSTQPEENEDASSHESTVSPNENDEKSPPPSPPTTKEKLA